MSKISGPLLDRIDIHLEVPSLKSVELMSVSNRGESSAVIKKTKLSQAREVQRGRFQADNSLSPLEKIFTNAHLNQKKIQKHCALTDEGKDFT